MEEPSLEALLGAGAEAKPMKMGSLDTVMVEEPGMRTWVSMIMSGGEAEGLVCGWNAGGAEDSGRVWDCGYS
jgi:hypothetical protein